jgi:hypothetical protein
MDSVFILLFYRTGVIGVKMESYESFLWAQDGPATISQYFLKNDTPISVHPAFWNILGIKPPDK